MKFLPALLLIALCSAQAENVASQSSSRVTIREDGSTVIETETNGEKKIEVIPPGEQGSNKKSASTKVQSSSNNGKSIIIIETEVNGVKQRREYVAGEPVDGNNNDPKEEAPEPKKVTWLGVAVESTDPALAAQMGLENPGLVSRTVQMDSPASRAGILEHDILLSLDGTDLTSPEQLTKEIRSRNPGDKVEFTLLRKGATEKIIVTLGETENKGDVTPGVIVLKQGQGIDGIARMFGMGPDGQFKEGNFDSEMMEKTIKDAIKQSMKLVDELQEDVGEPGKNADKQESDPQSSEKSPEKKTKKEPKATDDTDSKTASDITNEVIGKLKKEIEKNAGENEELLEKAMDLLNQLEK